MIRQYLQREIRRELRSGGYTDLLLAGLDNTIRGTDAETLTTGALEAAAGLWARTLASARVEGTDVLTRRIRHRIGRDLIRQGESVFELRTDGGTMMLIEASEWDVLEGWRYRLDFATPPGNITQRTVPRGRVAHFMWAENPREPWRGVAPLAAASKLGTLIARAEDKLAQDLKAPTAHLLPTPKDGGDSNLDSLRNDIGNAEGAAVLVEATSTGWDDDRHQAGTRRDWKSERLGPEVPESLISVYRDVADAVLAACGIPADLVRHDADGTAQRESWRRWIMGTVQPMADLIADTASAALEVEVRFDFAGLHAHDITARATALGKLTDAGLPMEEAQRLVGLV